MRLKPPAGMAGSEAVRAAARLWRHDTWPAGCAFLRSRAGCVLLKPRGPRRPLFRRGRKLALDRLQHLQDPVGARTLLQIQLQGRHDEIVQLDRQERI